MKSIRAGALHQVPRTAPGTSGAPSKYLLNEGSPPSSLLPPTESLKVLEEEGDTILATSLMLGVSPGPCLHHVQGSQHGRWRTSLRFKKGDPEARFFNNLTSFSARNGQKQILALICDRSFPRAPTRKKVLKTLFLFEDSLIWKSRLRQNADSFPVVQNLLLKHCLFTFPISHN